MKEQNDLVISQDREIPVQVGRHAAFAWRYAYHRASDTRKANDLGQDFLTFRYDDSSFIFALCDGVGQSFFGDLASRFLGTALMDWLSNDLSSTADVEAIRTGLSEKLTSLTGEASRLVKTQPLPRNIPKMLHEVLEQKRGIGSESTFACGRIDLPSVVYPEGRMVLAWMGDSRIRMWDSNSEQTSQFGDTFKTEQRWSTRLGPVKGKPNIYLAPLKKGDAYTTNQLAVYSDGLSLLDALPRTPSTSDVDALIERAVQSATSDDISFLEIGVGVAAPEAAAEEQRDPEPVVTAAPRVPAPKILSAVVLDRRVNVSWEPVQGVKQYQVELDNGRPNRWDVRSTVWASPPLDPSNYKMRIRAMGDELGDWSPVVTIEIPLVTSTVPTSAAMPAAAPAPVRAAMPTAAIASSPPGRASSATAGAAVAAPPVSAHASAPAQPPLLIGEAAPPPGYSAPARARSGGLPIVLIVVAVVALLVILGVAFMLLANSGTRQGGQQSGSVVPSVQTGGAAAPTSARPLATSGGGAAGPTASYTITPTPRLSDQTSRQPTAVPIVAAKPTPAGPISLLQTLRDYTTSVSAVTFGSEGPVLATAAGDGKIRLYKGDGWQPVLTRSGLDSAFLSVAFSPDGKILGAGEDTGRIWLWQSPWEENGGKSIRFILAHDGPVSALSFSPDGTMLASASDDKSVKLWSIPSGREVGQPLDHPDAVNSVAFSPDGKTLATGSNDGKLRVWAVPAGSLDRTESQNTGSVNAVAYSPDGNVLAAADAGGSILLLNLAQNKATTIAATTPRPIASLAFSPDGKVLAVGNTSALIDLWDVTTGKFLFSLDGHTAGVTCVAFAPGGSVIASSSADKSVILWGTGTAKPISDALLAAGSSVGAGATPIPAGSGAPLPAATPTASGATGGSGTGGGARPGNARPTPTRTPSIAP